VSATTPAPPSGRVVAAGLLAIGLVLAAGAINKLFLPAAAALAGAGIMVLIVGSAFRTYIAVLGLHICLNTEQLGSVAIFAGPFRIRPDIVLMALVVLLWATSSLEGRRSRVSGGLVGKLIAALLALTAVGFFRGMASPSAEPEVVVIFLYALGGYLMFYPLMWMLARTENPLSKVLLMLVLFGGIAGLNYIMMGISGTGADLYYRTTGLRIATRQPNAMAMILVLLTAVLWKDRRSAPPAILAIPAGVVMVAAVLLCQTRGIWLGIAASIGLMFLLSLFKREREGSGAAKQVLSMLLFVGLVALGIMLVGALDLLSTGELAQRAGGESGSLLTETSVITRYMAWGTVLDKAASSPIFGHGIGATVTFFHVSRGMMFTTNWVDGSLFQMLLMMGLLGVAVLSALYIAGIVDGARLFMSCRDRARSAMALGATGSLVLVGVISLTGSAATGYRFTVLWALPLAMIRYLRHLERRSSRAR